MRYTVDIINDLLKEYNWKLISDKYTNLNEQLIFECGEGHRVYDSWNHIRAKRNCPVCAKNTYKNIESKVTKQKKCQMRYLALDQSSRITGYAIYDDKELVEYGKFETSLDDEIERANQLKQWLISMCNTWKIDFVAIEGVQYQQNFGVTTFQTLCRVQGILMECCLEMGIPYEVCPTNTWRHECGVKGRSRVDRKRSMQLLVKEWYDIKVSDDESDAIGIGHYIVNKIGKQVEIVEWE